MIPVTALPRVLRPRRAAPPTPFADARRDQPRPPPAQPQGRQARGAFVEGLWRAEGRRLRPRRIRRRTHPGTVRHRRLLRALLEEAIELREAGIRAPILAMGGYYGQAWDEVLARRVTPVIYDVAQAEGIARHVRITSHEAGPVWGPFQDRQPAWAGSDAKWKRPARCSSGSHGCPKCESTGS